MISLAMNVYAALFLLGVGLLCTGLLGAVGFFAGRAILRRVRTSRWTPAVGDCIMFRLDGRQGTIKQIDGLGSKFLVEYWPSNSATKDQKWSDRSKVFFLNH
jgi:hypothetical protein